MAGALKGRGWTCALMGPFQFRIGARCARPSKLTRNKSCSRSVRRFRSLAFRRPREPIKAFTKAGR